MARTEIFISFLLRSLTATPRLGKTMFLSPTLTQAQDSRKFLTTDSPATHLLNTSWQDIVH